MTVSVFQTGMVADGECSNGSKRDGAEALDTDQETHGESIEEEQQKLQPQGGEEECGRKERRATWIWVPWGEGLVDIRAREREAEEKGKKRKKKQREKKKRVSRHAGSMF